MCVDAFIHSLQNVRLNNAWKKWVGENGEIWHGEHVLCKCPNIYTSLEIYYVSSDKKPWIHARRPATSEVLSLADSWVNTKKGGFKWLYKCEYKLEKMVFSYSSSLAMLTLVSFVVSFWFSSKHITPYVQISLYSK